MKKLIVLLLIRTFSFSQEKELTVAQIDSIYIKAINSLSILKSSNEITYFEIDSINSKYKTLLENNVFKFYDDNKLTEISIKEKKSIPIFEVKYSIDSNKNVFFYITSYFFKAEKEKKSKLIKISIEKQGIPDHKEPDLIFTYDNKTLSWKITKNEYHFEF